VDRTNAFNCLSIFATRRRARLFAGDAGGGFVVTGVSAFAAFVVVVAIAGRCDEEFTANQSKIAFELERGCCDGVCRVRLDVKDGVVGD